MTGTDPHAHQVLVIGESVVDVVERDGTTTAHAGGSPLNVAYGLARLGLPTAFAARAGSGTGPLLAILCEYDALPGVGHACGHNVIAAIGAGAGIAAAAVVDELDGRLLVLGTPAEEGGGGKIDLISAGAFDGVDAALMVHPAGVDLTRMDAIAVAQYRVRYEGVATHAAAAEARL